MVFGDTSIKMSKDIPYAFLVLVRKHINQNLNIIIMSLIKCPECQKEVSSNAKTCPHCGYPIERECEQIDATHESEEEVDENYYNEKESASSIQNRFNLLKWSVPVWIAALLAGGYYAFLAFKSTSLFKQAINTGSDAIFEQMDDVASKIDLIDSLYSCLVLAAAAMAGFCLVRNAWRKKLLLLCSAAIFLSVLSLLLGSDASFSDSKASTVLTLIGSTMWIGLGLIYWTCSDIYLAKKFGQYQFWLSVLGVVFDIVMALELITDVNTYYSLMRGVCIVGVLEVFSIGFITYISASVARVFWKEIDKVS